MSKLLYKQQCDVFSSTYVTQVYWKIEIQYHLNNVLNRDPMLGPAVILKDKVEYWIKGRQIKERKA
jgi:hypothetical protein